MATQTAAKPIRDLRERPLIGSMREFQRDRLSLFLRVFRECGEVARIHFGPFPLLVFSSPEMVQTLLVEHGNDLWKGATIHRAMEPVVGNGLIINEGESWRGQRKMMAPVFAHRHIASYADTMVACSERAQAGWGEGTRINVAHEMVALTMRIVGKALFDADVVEETDDLGAAITTAVQYMDYSITHLFPVPLSVPTPRSRRTKAALAVIQQRMQAMIAERRASGEERADFLSLLLSARDEGGAGMSDTQIRDEALTLFVAGHETTANTLAWCWYFLAKNPDLYARLREEVDTVLGGRPATF